MEVNSAVYPVDCTIFMFCEDFGPTTPAPSLQIHSPEGEEDAMKALSDNS
jgi:hypothetical protein